jgi:hypothetical protein
MSLEAASDPRIRPHIGRLAEPAHRTAQPGEGTAMDAAAPFRGQGHRGGTRVFDLGPGADHPTGTADLGFADLLDVVNPLQHLPLISSVYRYLTGDEIKPAARIMGGTLYGGPIGFAVSAINTLASEIGGGDPGDAALAMAFGTETATEFAALPEGTEAAETAQRVAARPNSTVPETEQYDTTVPLIGQAALQALVRDLGTGARSWEPVEAAPEALAGTGNGQVDASMSPQHFFTARMLDGLDKYRALAQVRIQTEKAGLDEKI